MSENTRKEVQSEHGFIVKERAHVDIYELHDKIDLIERELKEKQKKEC